MSGLGPDSLCPSASAPAPAEMVWSLAHPALTSPTLRSATFPATPPSRSLFSAWPGVTVITFFL